ncbi:unnamed protein product [Rhizophagus irregularis]|uniref:Uncharacterized protein n=1 Tax=Rhizophagus irregularis TaxID=588596 RepID=A0A2N1MU29_9GLOM|nr:hypothetical protein RhiirC2_786584 [Rhizophagus irregularis]CAB4380714.1 unnamed protein product [Rhizophagus irregularis]CAB5366123.1 unnamed protein product [Rhizophagus irregularis]
MQEKLLEQLQIKHNPNGNVVISEKLSALEKLETSYYEKLDKLETLEKSHFYNLITGIMDSVLLLDRPVCNQL